MPATQNKLVKVDGLGVVAFPDDMPDDEIATHINKTRSSPTRLKQLLKPIPMDDPAPTAAQTAKTHKTSGKAKGVTTEQSERQRQQTTAQPLDSAIPSWVNEPLLPKAQKLGNQFEDFLTHGAAKKDREERERKMAEFDAQNPVQGGVAAGINRFAEGMTTPANLGLIAVAPESKLLSAYFAIQALRGSYKNAQEAEKAYKAGNNKDAAQYATESLLGAGVATAAGAHAVRGTAIDTSGLRDYDAKTIEGEFKKVPPNDLVPTGAREPWREPIRPNGVTPVAVEASKTALTTLKKKAADLRPPAAPPSMAPLPGEEQHNYIHRRLEEEKYGEGLRAATAAGLNVVRDYAALPPVPEGKIRVYHGTHSIFLPDIGKNGLITGKALGHGGLTPFVLATTKPQVHDDGPFYGRPGVVVADVPKGPSVHEGLGVVDLPKISREDIVGVYIPKEVVPKAGIPYSDFERLIADYKQGQAPAASAAPSIPAAPVAAPAAPAGVQPVSPEANKIQKPDTPEFKQFYGNSKVPDVVYHGTQAKEDFNAFKPNETGEPGFHFGTVDQAQAAIGLSQEVLSNMQKYGGEPHQSGRRIMPVHLSIQNPLRLPDLNRWTWDDMKGPLQKVGIDLGEKPKQTAETADMWENSKRQLQREGAQIAAAIEKAGYDGIVYKNAHEAQGKSGDSYIAFRPEQVKSAIGNQGTFDPTNADITKSQSRIVYQSPSPGPGEISYATAQLAKINNELEKNPPPLEPIDATPEALKAWKEKHDEWLKKTQPWLDKWYDASRRLEAISTQNLGQIRKLNDGTPVLYLNPQGLRSLYIGFGVKPTLDFTLNGASIEAKMFYPIMHNLDILEPLHYTELRNLLTQARDKNGILTIAAIPQKGETMNEALGRLREELNHGWQKAFADAVGNHLTDEHFSSLNDMPKGMWSHLETNYPEFPDDGKPNNNKHRVLEATAKLMSEPPQKFGVTDEEYEAYLKKYFEAIEQEHGDKALDELVHITTRARAAKEEFKNAKRGVAGSSEGEGNVSGLQGREAEGTGPETERGVQAGSSGTGPAATTDRVIDWLLDGARDFAAKHGRDINFNTNITPDFRAMEIADAYSAMQHNPSDPQVKATYSALTKDIDEQWNYATKKLGVTFEPWKKEGQPYANSKEMMEDVRNNKHLFFFQGGELPADHPLAQVNPDTGLSYNDELRAVHDLFGHAMEGYQFGPRGEENAWNAHSQMFSPEALPAVTTETKGQNSWVNSGPHMRNAQGGLMKPGDPGFIAPADRPFSENKAGLLPENYHYRVESPISFVSPNVHDLNLEQAGIRTGSRTHRMTANLSTFLARDLKLRPVVRSATGFWEGGAEDSLVHHFAPGANPDAVLYHALNMAKLGNQNAVTSFFPQEGGPDKMYAFEVPKDKGDVKTIADLLLANGIQGGTIEPTPHGHTVLVSSEGGKHQSTIDQIAEKLGVQHVGEIDGRSVTHGDFNDRAAAGREFDKHIGELEKKQPEWRQVREAFESRPDYADVHRLIRETKSEDLFVEATHGSRVSGLTELDPTKGGTGPQRGAETQRKKADPDIYPERTYLQQKGTTPERPYGQLANQYEAKLNRENLYDLEKDPDNLKDKIPTAYRYDSKRALTYLEKLVKDAGYEGVLDPRQGVIEAFKNVPVRKIEHPLVPHHQVTPVQVDARMTRRPTRTYEDVQHDIDAMENKLEEGKGTRMFYFTRTPGSEIMKGAVAYNGTPYEPMPSALEDLYDERDKIGSDQLKQSIGEISDALMKSGIKKEDELREILNYYMLDASRTDGPKQYLASKYTMETVNKDPLKQAADIYSTLAPYRDIPMDDRDDLWTNRDLTKESIAAVKAVRDYFYGGDAKALDVSRNVDKSQKKNTGLKTDTGAPEPKQDLESLKAEAEKRKPKTGLATMGEAKVHKNLNDFIADAKERNPKGKPIVEGRDFDGFFASDNYDLRHATGHNMLDPESVITGNEISQGMSYANSRRQYPDIETYVKAASGDLGAGELSKTAPRVRIDQITPVIPEMSKRKAGPNNPGIDVPDETNHGLWSQFRVSVPKAKDVPDKPLIIAGTKNTNAAKYIANLDKVLDKHPDAAASIDNWAKMTAYAFGTTDVPVPPYALIRDLNGDGMEKTLESLTPQQIEHADAGIANAQEFRRAYTSGELGVDTTGKLFLWAILSRGVSPYVQESMFIDAFNGAAPWIEKAAAGKFTAKDLPKYDEWAYSIAPIGSDLPGSTATHNLTAFGRHFLTRMSQNGVDGKTHLQHIHDLMSDPDMTGKQIRREFQTFREGIGVDNKVMSFLLLVTGHPDVFVLDRVQFRNMWDDGRFNHLNIYDGFLPEGETKHANGSRIGRLGEGVRGLLYYEAIERAVASRVNQVYGNIGRGNDASIGRYHWESWVSKSGQEAGHGTLSAILGDAKGDDHAIANVSSRQGEFGAYAYGTEYYRDEYGTPFFDYNTPTGNKYGFSVPNYRGFLSEIKQPRNGVVPTGFRVELPKEDPDGKIPWYSRPGVDQEALDKLAEKWTDKDPKQGRRIASKNLLQQDADSDSDGADTDFDFGEEPVTENGRHLERLKKEAAKRNPKKELVTAP